MEKRAASDRHTERDDGNGSVRRRAATRADGADRGLAALREAGAAYSAVLEQLAEERAAGADMELRASLLADANVALQEQQAALADRVRVLTGESERLEERVAAQRARADRLLVSVREMHRALYRGSTPEHVLRAAIDLTEARRGYYVAKAANGTLTVRAAVDVPAAVGSAPSAFIESITERVLHSAQAVCWNDRAPVGTADAAPDERFRVGAAVPVSVHGEPSGVIIVLDKNGTFEDDDIDSLLSVGSQAGVAVENARLRQDVQQAYISTIAVLADTVAAKDPYTHGHCEQVSHYARLAAERLQLTDAETRVACYAALLHDVGKIGVSDGVLNKPGPLLAEERRLVEAHVRIGHDLLTNVPALRDVASAVLYHHEWYDGSGYPSGLAGEDIPIASRIVGTVDAYCAMLDRRSYKEPVSPEAARAELLRCSGTQFDPRIVEAVLEAIGDADAHAARSSDGHGGADGHCGVMPDVLVRREQHASA